MTNITLLEGKYQIQGKNLTNSLHRFILTERQKITQSKSKSFILYITPEGNRKYISSLYTTDTTGVFRFDYKGINYKLVNESEQTAIITKL